MFAVKSLLRFISRKDAKAAKDLLTFSSLAAWRLRVSLIFKATTKVSPSLFATKTRRKAKARRVFRYFSFVSSKNFEPSWLLAT